MNSQNELFYWIDFILIRHFGSFCLTFALIAGCIQTLHSLIAVRKRPELKEEYQKLILGFTLFMGLPWLFIALGELVQGIPGMYYFFLFGNGNFFSWIFVITIFCEYAIFLYWLWFRKGAELLFSHPLLFYRVSSPRMAQILFTLMILGGIIGISFLISITV
jgi:hypothetical protein